ncbi:N-acetylglucosamine-6-phosphate deacetylase [Oricola sp.]|uniref:N-acetylglucosamine-6-phosphate deacetylase n=1 Tax=Oricola sp. TaxID=1979950 RepID=UPI0025FE5FC7|nr:N-acetylglucosamine-6-phosphate deacetylase [Oricola sp.]MCI5074713.1 N-acetylglucosamine-6-phosphate deacetylase [Oricola sp.]
MTVIEGRVLTPDGLRNARVSIEHGRIARIEKRGVVGNDLILPGFIDLHCHGGGGADIMEAGDAPSRVASAHAANGTTAFLATTMTAPLIDIEAALVSVRDCASALRNDEAAILGVHLEGPFIDREKLGAQPDFAIDGDTALMQRLMALAEIRVVTCAPEADPDGAMTRWLRDRGVRVQIGHSSCDYETAAKCFLGGRHGVTHMFNAMSPLHHRAPGIVGAALAHAEHAELIPDLLHVHPGAIRAALRAIPNLYAVTDATPASGMPDGDYRLGTQHVRKCGNGVRLEDGTLAGSSLTMHQAFRNLVEIGLSPEEASRRTSTIAADYLGIRDRGRIAPGAIADLVIVDESLEMKSVVLRGTEFSGS